MYIYISICNIYIYIYIERERERERARERESVFWIKGPFAGQLSVVYCDTSRNEPLTD